MKARIHEHLTQVREDAARNQRLLHLTANEPWVSETARAFLLDRIADRYFMGAGDAEGVVDFGPFTFLGCSGIGGLVDSAATAAETMLGAASVNFGGLSGVHAMMCAILATTEPGDAVMSVHLDHGGHFATRGILERTGRRPVATTYDVEALSFDTDVIARACRDADVTAIYLDVSFYVNPHDLRALRQAVGDEVVIIYDASHTLGLIMGGRFQDPLAEGADVVCGNTHKTLPGPQKGLLAFGDDAIAERANAVVNAGLFSSTHTGSLIALATTILEMQQFGRDYAQQVITNANALGEALTKRGLSVRRANTGRFTENHQVHLLTEEVGHYRDLYRRLIDSNISVNFDRPLGGRMFIRLGTQEITRRGMAEAEMEQIASLLADALDGKKVGSRATALASSFTRAHYSFDEWEDPSRAEVAPPIHRSPHQRPGDRSGPVFLPRP